MNSPAHIKRNTINVDIRNLLRDNLRESHRKSASQSGNEMLTPISDKINNFGTA